MTLPENLNALAATAEGSKRWGLDSCYLMHATPNRSIFRTYRDLTDNDNRRTIGGIGDQLPPIDKGQVELKVNVQGKCKLLVLDNVSYIPNLSINLIFKEILMRSSCLIKIVPRGIEIDKQRITA